MPSSSGVCLESDKHLCEVAACHQILAIVLGKPADVAIELRERIYALGDPEKAAVHVPGAAAAATHEARRGAPPAADNGRPAPKPAPLEVPEYLRDSRPSSVWPYVGLMAAALVLVVIALRSLGPFDANHPLARLMNGPQQIAETTEEDAAPKSPADNAAAVQTTIAEPVAAAQSDATATDATATEAPSAPVERAVPETSDRVAAATPAPTVPTAAIPETPDSTAPAATITVPAPATTAAAPAAPTVATLPKLPRPKAPAAEPPPKPIEVGRYTSDGQLFATLDPGDGLWYAKQSQEIITAGERLVVLPPYRPQIALPSAVQLIFAGEGALKMDEPDESRTPRVSVDYGRFIVATAGKAGAQVQLELAGIKGLLTLVDADSELAIKVAPAAARRRSRDCGKRLHRHRDV